MSSVRVEARGSHGLGANTGTCSTATDITKKSPCSEAADEISVGSVKSSAGVDAGGVAYTVEETPPWYLCGLLGFQHFITMYLGGLSVPLLLAGAVCMDEDNVAKSRLISTGFFVCGLATLLQVLLGTRLPIVQISTFAVLTPTQAFLSLPQFACPIFVKHANDSVNGSVVVGSPEHREIWSHQLNVVNGSIMVASVFEVLLGLTGAVGFLLRYMGPLTICPTIALIGVSLFRPAAELASQQWGIAMLVVVLMVVFSQYLAWCRVPCCAYHQHSGCSCSGFPLFKMFPVLLAVLLAWLVCLALTLADVLPTDPALPGYWARTDARSDVIAASPWFYVPYPGQWGRPAVSAALVLGVAAGLLASVVESVGDYAACARVAGARTCPPPRHAVNRGILVEGVSCIIAGAFGAGNGTTSNSTNIGVISLTRVGSRMVVLVAACMMIVTATLSKFGALFTTIPDPVVGGAFLILFGLIVSVGISNLQYVDMNSSRNLFIFGFSFFFGLALPEWFHDNPDAIDTGSETADSMLTVLLSTNMFVGGAVGFLLDNTIPGTKEERGFTKMNAVYEDGSKHCDGTGDSVYDIPGSRFWSSKRIFTYIPVCPTYKENKDAEHSYL